MDPPTAETFQFFYFTYCVMAELKQFSQLEAEFVLLFNYSFISIVRAP